MKPIDPRGNKSFAVASSKTHTRREVLVGATVGAVFVLHGKPAAANGKKTFTILHTNDIHSNFVGMSPEADYTPFSLNDDKTRGGLARLATLIAERKAAREAQGPVLVLDDGDYSNGTAFGAATRETGSELQLLFRMGFDATTFGNHEFDFGPEGLGTSIAVAAKAGRTPPIIVSNIDLSKDDPTLVDQTPA
jgi:5'-nucleotidase / UDP-sugar diphosphatase